MRSIRRGRPVSPRIDAFVGGVRPYGVSQLRLSNEDFKKTLHKLNSEYKRDSDDAINPEGSETSSKKEGDQNSKGEGKEEVPASSGFKMPTFDMNAVMDFGRTAIDFVVTNVREGYAELTGESKETYLSRKVQQADSYRKRAAKVDEDEDLTEEERAAKEAKEREEAGPSAIVLVKDPKSAWESMKERLQDSPFIREILKNSKKVKQQAAATDIGKQATNVAGAVGDKIEDLRTFWDTSQNPLVYTISGVWENMTGETEEGIAIAEIRKLDPKFNKEEWADEVKHNLAPEVIKAHLQGNTSALKPWLGEAVYNKLAADIRTRKHDGIVFDPKILDIEENQVILRHVESGSPVIVVVYMVQQINCIRNRKGEIIEVSSMTQ
jgi:import inner membrane translocase subunit TIM44